MTAKKIKINPIIRAGLIILAVMFIISNLPLLFPSSTGLIKKFSSHSKNLLLTFIFSNIIIGIGELTLTALKFNLKEKNFAARFLMSYGSGAAVLSQVIFLLSALHLFKMESFIIPAAAILLIMPFLRAFYVSLNDALNNADIRRGVFCFESALFVFLLPFLTVFLTTLCPPTAWDAQTYHLLIPKRLLEAGGLTYIPFNIYSNMPFNINLLYAFAMGLSGEEGVRIFAGSLSMMLLIGFLVVSSLELRKGAAAGICAALIFASSPIALYGSAEALIDVQMGFFALLGIWAFLRWSRDGNFADIFLTALFFGFLCGCKYTGFYIPLAAFIAGFFIVPKERHKFLFLLPISCGAFILPWLIKSLYYTGNPVYPMFFGIFGGRDWTKGMYGFLIDWQDNIGMGRSALDYIKLPFRVFFQSNEGYKHFAGKVSFVPAILFLAAFFINEKRTRRLLMITAVAGFAFWAYGPQQTRFMLPILAIASLAGGAGLASLAGKIRAEKTRNTIIASAIFIIAAVGLHYNNENFLNMKNELRYVFGRQSKDDFLSRRIWSRDAYIRLQALLEKELQNERNALFIFENMGYYFDGNFSADGMFEASALIDIALDAGNAEGFKKSVLDKFKVKYFLVNNNIVNMIEAGIRDESLSPYSSSKNRLRFAEGFYIIKEFLQKECVVIFEENGTQICVCKA